MAPKRRKPNPKTGKEDEESGLNSTHETPSKLTAAAQKRKAKSNISVGDVGIDNTTGNVQFLASPTNSTSVTPAERKPPPRKRKANPKYDYNDGGGDDNDQEEDDRTTQCKKPRRGNQSKRPAAPRKSKTQTKQDDDHDRNDQTDEDEKLAVKLAAGTPTRASAPRLRKANPKYADEEDEDIEDDEFVKRVQHKAETPKKRTPASRKAKVQRDDPEWLVTNENSPLAYEDLHAELSNPKTYEGFTKEDWEDLRSTLPADVPLNPDGYSISDHFLKYNPDFRRGIREFQEDLATGRLDPKWQAAAAEAMEQRARGDFDDWKEKNYEEFWGQKQKLQPGVLAGDSTKVTLKTMIENGMFHVGDEVVFSRVIGRKEKRVLIEKELKIIAVGEDTLTFAIPPGQQKFARSTSAPQPPSDVKANQAELESKEDLPKAADMNVREVEEDGAVNDKIDEKQGGNSDQQPSIPEEVLPETGGLDSVANGVKAAQETETGDSGIDIQMRDHDKPDKDADGDEGLTKTTQPVNGGLDTHTEGNETAVDDLAGDQTGKAHDPGIVVLAEGALLAAEDPPVEASNGDKLENVGESLGDNFPGEMTGKGLQTSGTDVSDLDRGGTSPMTELSNGEIANGELAIIHANGTNNNALISESKPPDVTDGVIHQEIENLAQLMKKAIEIDGRLDPKDIKQVPASSPWKFMRLKRNNQDLGTLFEMREEFYAYKLPKLQKMTKG